MHSRVLGCLVTCQAWSEERQKYTVLNVGARSEWVVITPQQLYAQKETWYQLYRKLSGPRAGLDGLEKILSPPGFDFRLCSP